MLIQDIFTDASLASHEYEIKRLENLIQSRQNALSLVKRHMELIAERQALEESSKDPSRLTQRGAQAAGRLLQEEKVRKKLSKELPKVLPHFHTYHSCISSSKTSFTPYRRGRTRTTMISWSTERDTSMFLNDFHELKKPPRAAMYLPTDAYLINSVSTGLLQPHLPGCLPSPEQAPKPRPADQYLLHVLFPLLVATTRE
jgi:hypothetical protein